MTMEFRLILAATLMAVGALGAVAEEKTAQFMIDKTWDGKDIGSDFNPFVFNLTKSVNSKDIIIKVHGPYFGDPVIERPAGQDFLPVYEGEVVEFFFLNDNLEYLEVELAPAGIYYVLLLKGVRNSIRRSLPLEFTSSINGNTWSGKAVIPGEYLPTQVTKFNAYAIHGTGENRKYWALYPTDGSTTEPDFHKLEFFRPIDSTLVESSSADISELWSEAINGNIIHTITKTWDGKLAELANPYVILLKGSHGTKDVNITIRAPYFGDKASDILPGEPNTELNKFEVIETYFLNDNGQHLQLQFGPQGHYSVFLLSGEKSYGNGFLPLVYQATINGNTWVGEAKIPGDYFPPQVTKFNAYAAHGTGEGRSHYSLFPAEGSALTPEHHELSSFHLIDMSTLDVAHKDPAMSSFWQEAIEKKVSLKIDKTWNGQEIEGNDPVFIELKGIDNSKDIMVIIRAPFFNDPAPSATPEAPFLNLWDYEVVQLFFLNDVDQYLDVEIGPHGHYIAMLLDGRRNTIRQTLPLEVTTNIKQNTWEGKFTIPGDYFPPKVVKMNAYAIHGVGEARKHWALHPAAKEETTPDFHNLDLFQPIYLPFSFDNLRNNDYSPIWQTALQGGRSFAARMLQYEITREWNSKKAEIPSILTTLQGFEGGVEMNYTVRLSDPKYPLVYFVLTFESADGNALKVKLFPTGAYQINMLAPNNVTLNAENYPLDYKVTEDVNTLKGSALVPPTYFPPLVNSVNMYAVFGMSKEIAMVLQPMPLEAGLGGGKPRLDSKEHFRPIDFDLLVKSNLVLSDVWKDLLEPAKYARTQAINRRPDLIRPPVIYTDKSASNPSVLKSFLSLRHPIPKRTIVRGSTGKDPKIPKPVIDNEFIFNVKLIDVEALDNEGPKVVGSSPDQEKKKTSANVDRVRVNPQMEEEKPVSKVSGDPQMKKEKPIINLSVSSQMKNEKDVKIETEKVEFESKIKEEKLDSPAHVAEISVGGDKKLPNEEELINVGSEKKEMTEIKSDGDVEMAIEEVDIGVKEGLTGEKTITVKVATAQELASKKVIAVEDKITEEEKITQKKDVADVEKVITDTVVTEDRSKIEEKVISEQKMNNEEGIYGQKEVIGEKDTKEKLTEEKRLITEEKITEKEVTVTEEQATKEEKITNEKETFKKENIATEKEVTEEKKVPGNEKLVAIEEVTSNKEIKETKIAETKEVMGEETEEKEITKNKATVLETVTEEKEITKEEHVSNKEISKEAETEKETKVKMNKEITKEVEVAENEKVLKPEEEAKEKKEVLTDKEETGEKRMQVQIMKEKESTDMEVKRKEEIKEEEVTEEKEITRDDEKGTKLSEEKEMEIEGAKEKKVNREDEKEIIEAGEKGMEAETTEEKEVTRETEKGMIALGEKDKENKETGDKEVTRDQEKVMETEVTKETEMNRNNEKGIKASTENEMETSKVKDVTGEKELEREDATGKQEGDGLGTTKKEQEKELTEKEETEIATKEEAADETKELRHNNKNFRLELPSFNKPLLYLLSQNVSPERKTSQRLFESSSSNKNVLPIPFKISIQSKDEQEEEHRKLFTGLNSQSINSFPLSKEDSAPETPSENDSLSVVDNTQKLDSVGVTPTEGTGVDSLDTVIDTSDYLPGLLPPPHPLCFVPGLVPDKIRCQVFYECVIENGKWEVYNWRCKRGYYYDSEKVACIRGVC